MRTNAIFANSEGCSEMGPSTSQRWAPSAVVPIAAVRISRPMAMAYTIQSSTPFQTSGGANRHSKKAATTPIMANFSWSNRYSAGFASLSVPAEAASERMETWEAE